MFASDMQMSHSLMRLNPLSFVNKIKKKFDQSNNNNNYTVEKVALLGVPSLLQLQHECPNFAVHHALAGASELLEES